MRTIRRFWTQDSTHYRNFQVVYTCLGGIFTALAVICVVSPGWLFAGASAVDVWLGGAAWQAGDVAVGLAQVVGTVMFAASALMVRWLRRDLEQRRSSLMPLVFLHGAAAVGWGGGFLAATSHPSMLVASGLEVMVCGIFVIFATVARADMQGRSNARMLPEPRGETPLGWSHYEQRWADAILIASLPADPASGHSGLTDIDLAEFWPSYIRRVPLQFRLGLRLATWTIAVWPLVTGRTFGTFLALSDDDRDAVLQEIAESRFFVIRQIVFLLKTTAGFAYFQDPDVQRQFPAAYEDRGSLDAQQAQCGTSQERRNERRGHPESPGTGTPPSEVIADGGSPGAVEESAID